MGLRHVPRETLAEVVDSSRISGWNMSTETCELYSVKKRRKEHVVPICALGTRLLVART